ncbi:MAG: DNRLRE domain-containing protein [Candidatus Hydrogenedens sp.]|nr:DNRLRE domain-containing protein [Candidatus Hydrogenedens sp.]
MPEPADGPVTRAARLMVLFSKAGGPLPTLKFEGTAMRKLFRLIVCAAALLPWPAWAGISLKAIDGAFSSALYVTSPPNDATRLFVVEQNGEIHIVTQADGMLPGLFLDLHGISNYDRQELGLLGFAFDPGYDTNGYVYVSYTRTVSAQIESVIARLTVNGDPATATQANLATLQEKLVVPQPYANHNGGMITFGPDGYLYAAFGDGGSAYDPQNRSQNLETYIGKLLRMDVSGEGLATAPPDNPYVGATPGLDLIWASGLRNPWRFSFDRDTGDLWIADVGQQDFEEINFQPADSTGGENYGWHAFEGNACNIPAECAPIENDVTFPIHIFPQTTEGLATIGGYRYRGNALPQFEGAYFYADFIQASVGMLRYTPGGEPEIETIDLTKILNAGGYICCMTSFGEDANGELLLVTQSKVYRVVDDDITYLDLEPVAQLEEPLQTAGPPGDGSRVCIIQRNGVIRLVQDGALAETPLIDLTGRVASDFELGLLGMAFHPDFASNGYFYLNYLRRTGESNEIIETVIARFTVNGDPSTATTADPDSELILMVIPKLIGDHNGGGIAFSPNDGYLYIPLGDGGCCEDPNQNAQNLTRLNGKIHRIDVDNTDSGLNYAVPADNPFIGQVDVPPTIWAYGLRNPFRCSFDAATGDFYFGDVGQNEIEEVNVQPASSTGGENYGWPIFEGTRCNSAVATQQDCDTLEPSATFPAEEYTRALGSSVTGGTVYRGSAITGLAGRYIYADYTYGRVYSFVYDSGSPTLPREYTEDLDPDRELLEGIVAISDDGVGELYLVSILGGVYKIVQGLGNDYASFDEPEGEGELPQQNGFEARLQPAKDATLYEDPAGAFANGTGPYFFAGQTGGNAGHALRRALLYFDIAGELPPDADILGAGLRMRVSKSPVGSGAYSMRLHRLTRAWNEGPTATTGAGGAGAPSQTGDATWLHTSYNTSVWTSPGGDYEPLPRAAANVEGTGFYIWNNDNLRDDVAGWLEEPGTNFGWILRGDETASKSARRFDSREAVAEQNRPELVIRYCGTPQDAWVMNTTTGHYYRATTALTHAEASELAACAGGYLATVNDAAENQWLVDNFVSVYGDAFLGYNDIASEGNFVWASGETPGYENWNGGEPNNFGGNENAVQIAGNGKWNDVSVDAVLPAIIERDTTPFFAPEGEGQPGGEPAEGEGAGQPAEGEGEGGSGPPAEQAALDALANFSAIDQNQDGALSIAEALSYFASQYGGGIGPGSIAQQLYTALNGNGGGGLTVGELRRVGGADSAIHAADTNGNGTLSLSEVLRVVQLYNAPGFACAANGGATEDGYTLSGADESCVPHTSDYLAPAFELTLSEMLRSIQFYNAGGLLHCPGNGAEDGFCPQTD